MNGNLTPLTSERASNVGKLARGVAKPITSFIQRKWCNSKCIYFDRCPAITASASLPSVNNGKHPCFIKTKSKEIQNYFFNLFEAGQEGLINITLDLHFRLLLSTNHDPNPSDLREAIKTTLEMMKTIYPPKEKSANININFTEEPEWISLIEAENRLMIEEKIKNARAINTTAKHIESAADS